MIVPARRPRMWGTMARFAAITPKVLISKTCLTDGRYASLALNAAMSGTSLNQWIAGASLDKATPAAGLVMGATTRRTKEFR